MARGSLLIFGTGLEGNWKVKVVLQETEAKGFREINGILQVVGESLLITNYESLTMAAQFKDVTLPEKHQEYLLMPLPDGDYICRIIQMFDPENAEAVGADGPDFVIEILKTTDNIATWKSIPWFKLTG